MTRKLLFALILCGSGCALNASVRYPWDKQQDHHETAPPAKPKESPSPEPTATPAKLEFDVSPLDIPDIKIAPQGKAVTTFDGCNTSTCVDGLCWVTALYCGVLPDLGSIVPKAGKRGSK